MSGLLLSVHCLSVPSALADLALVASCVSGWEEGRGEEGLAGAWGEFTTSLVLQIKKAEMDRKTLDWEIVELTNKLLDAKNTINKLEELNVCALPGSSLPMASFVLTQLCSLGQGWTLNHICICRSGTGWTATWLCSSSSATNLTSVTTNLLM